MFAVKQLPFILRLPRRAVLYISSIYQERLKESSYVKYFFQIRRVRSLQMFEFGEPISTSKHYHIISCQLIGEEELCYT